MGSESPRAYPEDPTQNASLGGGTLDPGPAATAGRENAASGLEEGEEDGSEHQQGADARGETTDVVVQHRHTTSNRSV